MERIGVDCPECRSSFLVASELAGKRGRCPKCREIIVVPSAASTPSGKSAEPEKSEAYALDVAPAAGAIARKVTAPRLAKREPAPTRPTRSPVEILAAFRGEIDPVRPTLAYRLWILAVAGVMLLLPAAYLGLVGLVGYGVYLHAVNNVVVFREVRSARAAILVYAGPIAVGGIVLVFMLKPLFARPARRGQGRAIDPSREPLIAAFVDGVCASVGSPTPSRIEVDCQVNASARLESWALSPSKELVLTIGLPLVAGLTLRQFTGVLAHEFGHFSQGAGMRLSLLVRSINLWFARVVYERDEWDEAFAGWAGEGHLAVIVVVALARASIWLTRRVLWVLMQVAHLVSGFLSRQMEFDADRYEARMVGSKTFAETADRLVELNLASSAAHAGLRASWRERRLPDDLPRLTLVEASKIPGPFRDAVVRASRARKTGLFDTHPADRDRVARAEAEGPDGIFALDGPATDLFRDFDALARSATYAYYRSMLGREVSRDQLYPVAEAVLNQEVRREGDEAFDRFFPGSLGAIPAVPLPATPPGAPADPKAARRSLAEARRAIREIRAEAEAEAPAEAGTESDGPGSWPDLEPRAVRAEVAVHLLKAGKPIAAGRFGLPRATIPAAEAAWEAAEGAIRGRREALGPLGQAVADRLSAALGLLEIEAVAAKVPEGPGRREEARALLACASALGGRIVPELGPLSRSCQATAVLIGMFREGKNDKDEALINAALRGGRQVHERLTELKWKVGDAILYPFEHAREGTTLGRYALPDVPDSSEVVELFQAGQEARDRLLDLHRRVFGRLAATAEAVEEAVGLRPEGPTA